MYLPALQTLMKAVNCNRQKSVTAGFILQSTSQQTRSTHVLRHRAISFRLLLLLTSTDDVNNNNNNNPEQMFWV